MWIFPGGARWSPRSGRGGIFAVLVPLALLLGAFFLVSRSETRPAPPPVPPPVVVFTPTFEHLPPVPGGHYEVWAEQPDGGTARLAAFAALPGGIWASSFLLMATTSSDDIVGDG